MTHPAEAVQQQAAAAAAAAAAAKMKASRLLPDWADGPVRVKRRRGERSSTGALGDDGAGNGAHLCTTLDYTFHGEWKLPNEARFDTRIVAQPQFPK
jgi:hypothetical protein